eukprot:CAMPEP_0195510244 /NCGR_PEP_ID=MMETSP0794_2-20130614/2935_1 /TAXON_ID=515487 /ORGANISM="Stephanopyxis turris, Strain CCMP 815" /LENGTH=428 /DNA_ID=CAMNT_0040637623 /DNA_START=90 /DNA_END=1373 /DNA_ORIENTATION=+
MNTFPNNSKTEDNDDHDDNIITDSTSSPSKHKPNPHSKWSKLNVSNNLQKHKTIIFACLMQSVCSISMVILNKTLVSTYNHKIANGGGDINLLILWNQAMIGTLCVELCRLRGYIEPYDAFDIEMAIRWCPSSWCFCLMMFTGLESLRYNDVPMVTVFKNTSCILVALGEYTWFRTNPVESRVVTVAFGLVGSGAILAAVSEVTMNPTKFGWMVYNSVATAGYVLCTKHTSMEHKSKQIRSLSKFEMVFYNHVLGAFFLFPAAFAKGEIASFYESSGLHTWGFLWRNLFAGLIGFALNFTSWNCIVVAGPTAYAIIGTLNAIPTSVLGYFLFHPEISIRTWFYIAVSTMGGFIYSYVKAIPSNTSVSASASKNKEDDEDYNSCENDTMSISDASCSTSATNSSSNNTSTAAAVVGIFHLPHNSEFAGW